MKNELSSLNTFAFRRLKGLMFLLLSKYQNPLSVSDDGRRKRRQEKDEEMEEGTGM